LSDCFKKAFVAFGGNVVSSVGTPKETILAALRELECDSLEVLKISNFYSTPAFPFGSGPDFVNAVASIQTDKNAEELLMKFHKVESIFDRTRFYRWAPRPIDIDLLAFEDRIHPSKSEFLKWSNLTITEQIARVPTQLILPHPRIQDRAFVLIPFVDVSKNWVHPVFKKSLNQMLGALKPIDKERIYQI
jgi:2-amino-4-hydroxy-6-hydroxymethyldihydropteridine diphosphokinase